MSATTGPPAHQATGPVLPRRGTHVVAVEVGDELVAWDTARRRAHRLNATAGLVLARCDGTTPVEQLVAELAGRFAVDPSVVAGDVEPLLDGFVAAGLVGPVDPAAVVEPPPAPPPHPAPGGEPDPTWTGSGGEPDPTWLATTPVLELIDARVQVRTDDTAAATELERTLSCLRADRADRSGPADPEHDDDRVATIDLMASSRPPVRLRLDGVDIGGGPTLDAGFALLHWRLNQLAVERSPARVLLHAAAVRRGGGVAVFPGSSNAGKSTLAAGLVRAGFGYVTDEAVAIEPSTGIVVAFPRAISLDRGSWPLFPEADPRLGGDLEPRHEWHVDPRVLHAGALDGVRDPARVTFVAFPRYERGATTRVEPIGPGEALVGLLANAFERSTLDAAAVEALAAVARGATSVRLTIGDLAEAVELLRPL